MLYNIYKEAALTQTKHNVPQELNIWLESKVLYAACENTLKRLFSQLHKYATEVYMYKYHNVHEEILSHVTVDTEVTNTCLQGEK